MFFCWPFERKFHQPHLKALKKTVSSLIMGAWLLYCCFRQVAQYKKKWSSSKPKFSGTTSSFHVELLTLSIRVSSMVILTMRVGQHNSLLASSAQAHQTIFGPGPNWQVSSTQVVGLANSQPWIEASHNFLESHHQITRSRSTCLLCPLLSLINLAKFDEHIETRPSWGQILQESPKPVDPRKDILSKPFKHRGPPKNYKL